MITSPAPGSTLTGSSVTFNWSAGSGASAYWLDAGSTPGGNQYSQSGNLGNTLSTMVNNLPTNGSAVYVTLYSYVGGQWLSNQYTYTAFNAQRIAGRHHQPGAGLAVHGHHRDLQLDGRGGRIGVLAGCGQLGRRQPVLPVGQSGRMR